MQSQLASFNETGDCTGGILAQYLYENSNKSQSFCQTLITGLKNKHLTPLISHITPQTDYKTIEAAFSTVLTEYNEKCVGPAADDVLEKFIEVRY